MEDTYLNHAVGLVNGIEDVRVASVVFIGDAVFLERKWQVVDVGHVENNLITSKLSVSLYCR